MVEIEIPQGAAELDRLIDELPNRPAVFLLWPRSGKPDLSRTNVLRKRLKRALSGVREAVERIEYQITGSRLAAQFLLLKLAKQHLGASYRNEIRLRLPPYVKLILTNPYPRTQVTSHIGRANAVYYGPFRSRATAARFESEFLDLFQLRRCQEDLAPRRDHPGCIYGEMGRCLRPCQMAVGIDEYRGESDRVADFLRTNGRSLTSLAEGARERLSAEMDFEGAALAHQRLQRIESVLSFSDELARDVSRLNSISITRAAAPNTIELGWFREGSSHGFSAIDFNSADGTPVSLDARLHELVTTVPAQSSPALDRMEHLAVLSKWFYSSWCDGELLLIDDWTKIPYRKLVNAVSRVAHGQKPPRPGSRS